MAWTCLTRNDYVTTAWSGGTTTQLGIAPEGAVYADRDFLWRLSSAKVELEHSDFTALPDYVRLISVLDGKLDMRVGDEDRISLAPLTVRSFDGATPVESWGRCTDFNLMLRKGRSQGSVQSLRMEAGSVCDWTAPVPAPQEYPHCTTALYCVSGSLRLPEEGVSASAGELLLCREAGCGAVRLESREGAALMAAVIYSR